MRKSTKVSPSAFTPLSNVTLKDNREINLRLLSRQDVNGVWKNFNEVVNEEIYLPAYTPVVDEWEKQSWYQDMVSGRNFCVIAEVPGKNSPKHVAGQCTIEDTEWEAATHVGQLGIIVRSDYRNSGLGFHLIEFAKKEAYSRGKRKLILTTFTSNKMGISLYIKTGFSVVGTYKKQYKIIGEYVDEVIMEFLYDDFSPSI